MAGDGSKMPREELIALVLGLYADRKDMQAALEQLRMELEELRSQIKGTPPNSGNSSTPPSRDRKGNRGLDRQRGQRGAKPGHAVHTRPLINNPNKVIKAKVKTCAGCGEDMRKVEANAVIRRQVTELPKVAPVVIETQQDHVTCPHCGKHNCGELPEGLEAQRQFGPRLEATLVYFMHEQHMSYERTRTAMKDLFGVDISEGGEASVMKRAGVAAQVKADEIAAAVKASAVINSDETSARVETDNWWEWVFISIMGIVHLIAHTRGAKVIKQFMGDQQAEVWVSDCHKSQLAAPTQTHQICLSHQVRDVQRVIEEHPDLSWGTLMHDLFQSAIHLRHKRDDLRKQLKPDDPHEPMHDAWYKGQRTKLENQLTGLLKDDVPSGRAETLRERFRTHRDHLFVFLYDPRVSPTNNASENALRTSVIHRKVTNCFRSTWGAHAYAAWSTVIDTAQLKGQAIFDTLVDLMGKPVLQFLDPDPARAAR